MLPFSLYITVLFPAPHMSTQEFTFSLYPTVDPVNLAQAFNPSGDCSDAFSLPNLMQKYCPRAWRLQCHHANQNGLFSTKRTGNLTPRFKCANSTK